MSLERIIEEHRKVPVYEFAFKEEEDINELLLGCEELFSNLVDYDDGFDASFDLGLLYGEIDNKALLGLMEETELGEGGVLDIGCGLGRSLVLMRRWFEMRGEEREIVGIELDEERATRAQNMVDEMDGIQVIHGDVFESDLDFSSFSLIFICATAFDDK